MTLVEKILNGRNVRQVIEEYSLSEGKLVPDKNGVIVLGTLAGSRENVKSLDIQSLSSENEGDEVWVFFNKTDTQYMDDDEIVEKCADYIKRGKIDAVFKNDYYSKQHPDISIRVKFDDGKTWYSRDYIFSPKVYSPEAAVKLVDLSNKRKGIDAAAETVSAGDLADRANLISKRQTFNSDEYGEGATIDIGCQKSRDNKLVTLYCYIAPNGGGHFHSGITWEIGYTYVNGRLKRHFGAFDMPRGRGWIDNKDVQSVSISQFDKDVKFLKAVQANPEKYSIDEIRKTLYYI